MTDTSKMVSFRKTIPLTVIYDRASVNPLAVFDEYPVDEIREQCLMVLEKDRFVYADGYITWFETRIKDCFTNRDRFWQRLLSWYIFRAADVDQQTKALEFAIGLTKEKEIASWGFGEISKLVAGKIKQNQEPYWQVPSMHEFLNLLLAPFLQQPSEKNTPYDIYQKYYDDRQWHEMKRVSRMVLVARDITFHPIFKAILERIEQGLIKPVEYKSDALAIPLHTAFLSSVLSVLGQIEKDQNPDLNATVGAFLREKANLRGSAGVEVQYIDRRTDPSPVAVAVRLLPTHYDERVKLHAICHHCRVSLQGEGCLVSAPADDTQQSPGYTRHTRHGEFDENLKCTFYVTPSRGMNRFWLRFVEVGEYGPGYPETLRDKKQEMIRTLAVMAGYIHLE